MNSVCFSMYVPYGGISHAGGGLFQSYLDLTEDLGSRLLVAPDVEHNRNRVPRGVDDLHVVPARPKRLDRLRNRCAYLLTPCRLTVQHQRALLHDEAVLNALRQADVVEYQWHEVATLLPRVRQLAPRARHVVFFHDIVSQALRRAEAESSPESPIRRARARLQVGATRAVESRIVAAADVVIVLSTKDAALLGHPRNVVVQRPLVRVAPWLRAERDPTQPPTFIFVAAFDRRENVEAAKWLCQRVWPAVRQSIGDAELRFVGGGSDRWLGDLLDGSAGIGATGFVDDLDEAYRRADVALVPIRRGAGVKLKTVEAIMTATPCVSTSVGVEGIERARDFVDVADEPSAFAAAAIRLASDTTEAVVRRANDGARWATEAHGADQARQTLVDALLGASPPTRASAP